MMVLAQRKALNTFVWLGRTITVKEDRRHPPYDTDRGQRGDSLRDHTLRYKMVSASSAWKDLILWRMKHHLLATIFTPLLQWLFTLSALGHTLSTRASVLWARASPSSWHEHLHSTSSSAAKSTLSTCGSTVLRSCTRIMYHTALQPAI